MQFGRWLTGGAALTVAATPVVASFTPPVAAAEPSGSTALSPDLPDPSTLESCTAKFGLTKQNSALLTLDVEVDAGITPAPTIGDGLTPVITVTGGSGADEHCIPERAWSDEAQFRVFMGEGTSGGVSEAVTYPGPDPYLVPGPGIGYYYLDYLNSVGSTSVGPIGRSGAPVTLTILIDATDDRNLTVAWSRTIQVVSHASFIAAFADGFDDLVAAVQSDQRDNLRGLMGALVSADPTGCDATYETPDLLAALLLATPSLAPYAPTFSAGDTCEIAVYAAIGRLPGIQMRATSDTVRVSEADELVATGGGSMFALGTSALAILLGLSFLALGERRRIV